ncbi:pancreatic lipase-related protein 2-like, partial [Zophobas morio]|uniref:pancreatic lipase-related protein 2-like n=1 Tax=Zophobas morio TaxID=2755281 RepID=UPI0030828676
GQISDNASYSIILSASDSVGEFYSKFLNKIVDYGVDPQNIHLVGHSLGAHVSGFAARVVKKGKIGRITALDPAKPGFDNIQLVSGGRLKKDDAGFVDVIHTCAGYLGVGDSIGHADFRPNGGSVPQPGCGNIFEMVEGCSHGRSWIYFAESLVSKTPFMGYPCDSFENFEKSDSCEDGEGVPMGDDTPSSTREDYYLRTGEDPPFAV